MSKKIVLPKDLSQWQRSKKPKHIIKLDGEIFEFSTTKEFEAFDYRTARNEIDEYSGNTSKNRKH